jgi:hypothetical protein
MKFQNFIINKFFSRHRLVFSSFIFLLAVHCSLFTVSAQKVALITPEKTANTEKLLLPLAEKLNALDSDLVLNALRATTYENIFNLSTEEAKRIGKAIGCEFFILLKSDTFRRSSFQKGDYFENFAVIYLVNSKTGHLIFWKIYSFEDVSNEKSEAKLFAETDKIADEIRQHLKPENQEKPSITEFSEDDKSVRSPLPFKRLKPTYTKLADLYAIKATIDIEVDLNEKGEVTRTEILRWAGFGLDESVTENVKKMNWRPAEKDGKTLPIRVLLRYNFKKVDSEK